MSRANKNNFEKKHAIYNNKIEYRFYFSLIEDMMRSLFGYDNLPETCDERFLERALFYKGAAILFEEPITRELFSLYAIPSGGFDIYGYPDTWQAMGGNGRIWSGLKYKENGIIFNSPNMMPGLAIAMQFAKRLSEIQRAMTTNINSTKTPLIFETTENKALTSHLIANAIDINQPYVVVENGVMNNSGGFGINSTNGGQIPYTADKLQSLKERTWSELMTFCGLDNANTEKKETILTPELESNNGQIAIMRDVFLAERQKGIKKVNSLFGTNIEVYFRQDRHEKEEKMYDVMLNDLANNNTEEIEEFKEEEEGGENE